MAWSCHVFRIPIDPRLIWNWLRGLCPTACSVDIRLRELCPTDSVDIEERESRRIDHDLVLGVCTKDHSQGSRVRIDEILHLPGFSSFLVQPLGHQDEACRIFEELKCGKRIHTVSMEDGVDVQWLRICRRWTEDRLELLDQSDERSMFIRRASAGHWVAPVAFLIRQSQVHLFRRHRV